MSRSARAVVLGALLLAVTLFCGPASDAADDEMQVMTIRRLELGGEIVVSDVVYATDKAVVFGVYWPTPRAEPLTLSAEFTSPRGVLYRIEELRAEAGATAVSGLLEIYGRKQAKHLGTWTARLLEKPGDTVYAEKTFELKPPALDPDRPDVRGILFWSDADGVDHPTESFAHDVRKFSVAVAPAKPLPSGHRLVSVVYDPKGKAILSNREQPFLSDQAGEEFTMPGWLIAGQPWAQAGGRFTYRLFWDEDLRPLLTIRFDVVTQNRWALIVGVEDYPPLGEGGNDLPGVGFDRQLMYDVLTQRYGFPDYRIWVLSDQNATRANVQAVFEEAAAKLQPDDAFVFYYSGHGTQLPDFGGDEDDGWDEALCTFAPEAVDAQGRTLPVSTREQMTRYLSDDDIATFLSKLRTPNVTVIFDSCHSGTAVRDVGPIAPPPVPLKERSVVLEFSEELLDRAEASAPAPKAAPAELDDRYVFLSACRASETSRGGALGGVFTTSLVRELVSSGGRTWSDILGRARATALRRNPGQYATVEGGGERFPFSLVEAAGNEPYIRPSYAVVGAVARLDAQGEANGATGTPRLLAEGEAGSHLALVSISGGAAIDAVNVPYAVYDAAAFSRLSGGQGASAVPIGHLRTTGKLLQAYLPSRANPGSYRASPPCPSAVIESGEVHLGNRLVPTAVPRPPRSATLEIVTTPRPTQDAERAKAAVRRALLAAPNLRSAPSGAPEPDYVVLVAQLVTREIYGEVAHPSGLTIGKARGSQQQVVEDLRKLITGRHNRYARALRLVNPSPSFGFEAELVGTSPVVKPGEKFTVRATADRPCYVSAFWLTTREGAKLSKGRLNLPVEPGKPFEMTLDLKPAWRGLAMVKLIASTKPLSLDRLQGASADATPDILFEALRAAHGSAGRGDDHVSTDGWDTAAVWFRTE